MNQIQEIPTIPCDGFTLRPFSVSDARSLVENINSSHIAKRVTNVPSPYTMIHAHSWLESMRINKTCIGMQYATPSRIDFAIDVGAEVAGSVAFIDMHEHEAQISYWLGMKHRRHGIMTKAVKEIVKFGFETCGFTRIWGYTWSDNIASRELLARAGFAQEGVLRKKWSRGGQFFDSHLFAIVV